MWESLLVFMRVGVPCFVLFLYILIKSEIRWAPSHNTAAGNISNYFVPSASPSRLYICDQQQQPEMKWQRGVFAQLVQNWHKCQIVWSVHACATLWYLRQLALNFYSFRIHSYILRRCRKKWQTDRQLKPHLCTATGAHAVQISPYIFNIVQCTNSFLLVLSCVI